jgi:acyl-CoA synthetase (AMP-forming)/AMP-acid ligase II/3-hydroxymyristoyl/3-hydroxydecanoyl-(acyl carrier protein) dehydratase
VRAEQRGGFPTKVEKPQTLLNPEAAPFVVLPTVGPTHIYGLLFGVLFPLASGGAFVRETPLLPETIAAQVRAHDVRLLVTVPAHLRAFEALSPKALAPLRHVVSSTAPLSDAIVDMMRTRHDLRITEVLGSTETGGIASRDRAVDPAWQALPGVTLAVDADARLLVTSPYVDQALPQPYRTQDTAELLSDGRIAHRGRADDIVKIGGRRVSLRAMETALLRHPDVTDAAVLAIADDTARSTRLVAIVSIGASTAVDGAALRGTLLGQFEPSTVPRKIHIRRALPREANGKLQRSPALRMVGLGPDGRPRVFEPVWLDATAAPCAHVFRVQLPENYAWFDGHFATYPVMAGAVQIEVLVLPCVRRARPTIGRITQLSKVKFLGRIGPGDTVTITLTWSSETPEDEGPWVDFRMTVGETGKTVTDGRAVFAAGTQCEASPG